MNDLPINLDPELLVAYVDKELPPAQMAAVEVALMQNGAARETVRQLRLSAAAAAHAYDAALRSESRDGVSSRAGGLACRGADGSWNVLLMPVAGS
jgi:anti-sigma factor RsiW